MFTNHLREEEGEEEEKEEEEARKRSRLGMLMVNMNLSLAFLNVAVKLPQANRDKAHRDDCGFSK